MEGSALMPLPEMIPGLVGPAVGGIWSFRYAFIEIMRMRTVLADGLTGLDLNWKGTKAANEN